MQSEKVKSICISVKVHISLEHTGHELMYMDNFRGYMCLIHPMALWMGLMMIDRVFTLMF